MDQGPKVRAKVAYFWGAPLGVPPVNQIVVLKVQQ
jgi:hypothetical protein